MATKKFMFKPKFMVRTSGRDYVVAASEDEVVTLRGKNFAALAALVAQLDSRDGVLHSASLPSDDVATAVTSFENAGLLTVSPVNNPPEAAYWDLLDAEPSLCEQEVR